MQRAVASIALWASDRQEHGQQHHLKGDLARDCWSAIPNMDEPGTEIPTYGVTQPVLGAGIPTMGFLVGSCVTIPPTATPYLELLIVGSLPCACYNTEYGDSTGVPKTDSRSPAQSLRL